MTTTSPAVQSSNTTQIAHLTADGGSANLLRTMIELARMVPRDDAAVERRLLDALTAYPALADKSVYRMKFKDKRAPTGFSVVSGLSIRAAETIASEMGYVWTEAAFAEDTADYVDVLGTAFDAQRANLQRRPQRVTKLEKNERGQMVVLGERIVLMRMQAGISKAVRNAILAIVPVRIRVTYETRCRELIAGGDLAELAPADKIKACLQHFAEHYKIEPERLVTYVGRPLTTWVRADLADLLSLYNALEDGETTIADAFPAGDSHAQPAKPEQEPPSGRVVDNPPGPTPQPAAEEAPPQPAATPPPVEPLHTDPPVDPAAVEEERETLKAIAAIRATHSKPALDKLVSENVFVAVLAKLSKPRRSRVLHAIGEQRTKLTP